MSRVVIFLMIMILAFVAEAEEVGNPHGPLKMDCTACHGTTDWSYVQSTGFSHEETGFLLRGGHEDAACSACHRDPRFPRVASACADCHIDIHGADLGYECASCHDTESWRLSGSALGLHAELGFPLIGVHAAVDCEACHPAAQGLDYGGASTFCVDCHSAEYEATTEPEHRGAGFSTDCELCHGAFSPSWGGGDFDHDRFYRLTGAHALIECLACHGNGYSGTPNLCLDCHADDYDGASDPDHTPDQFDTNCLICHNTRVWTPATFDHALTAFPLTGAHRDTACLLCHTDGYAGTPEDCNSCHADVYASADPDHVAAGFNRECEFCHGTSSWIPSTWDHDTLFPIYRGKHREAWSSCLDCHLQPTDYGQFSCVDCHEHRQSEVDDEHEGVADYIYDSLECLFCHPDGDE